MKMITPFFKNLGFKIGANKGLFILYSGTLALIVLMVLQWPSAAEEIGFKTGEGEKGLFVDDLMLVPGDLELGKNTSLINITLNELIDPGNVPRATKGTEPSRDKVYKKILEQKVKKAENKPVQGFDIKPLPK